jgi:hypothetical protein
LTRKEFTESKTAEQRGRGKVEKVCSEKRAEEAVQKAKVAEHRAGEAVQYTVQRTARGHKEMSSILADQ